MKLCCQRSTLGSALRIAVGVSVALIGLVHYQTLSGFTTMVSDGLGDLSPLGSIWAYILPALQIIGGLWFAFDKKSSIPTLLLGVAFGSIAIGMLAKVVLGNANLGGEAGMMSAAQNALLWLTFATIATMSVGKCDK